MLLLLLFLLHFYFVRLCPTHWALALFDVIYSKFHYVIWFSSAIRFITRILCVFFSRWNAFESFVWQIYARTVIRLAATNYLGPTGRRSRICQLDSTNVPGLLVSLFLSSFSISARFKYQWYVVQHVMLQFSVCEYHFNAHLNLFRSARSFFRPSVRPVFLSSHFMNLIFYEWNSLATQRRAILSGMSKSDNPEIYARLMDAFENVHRKKSSKLTFYTVFYSRNEDSRRLHFAWNSKVCGHDLYSYRVQVNQALGKSMVDRFWK